MVKPTTGKPSERSDSRYTGVRKRKWGKWVSEIRLPNSRERIWLGSYDKPEKAARAFDAALFCLRGKGAKFNFPDNPPEIAGGRSLTRPEIQAAAARFANEEPPKDRLDGQEFTSEYLRSPSSVSDGTIPTESDPTMDWSLFDLDMTTLCGDSLSDFSAFSEINYFPDEFLPPVAAGEFLPPVAEVDFGEEINDGGVFPQQSFLWNF